MYLRKIDKTAATEVGFSHATVLFSYSTPVAARFEGSRYRTAKYHSVTTSKHINQWLGNNLPHVEMPQAWFDGLVDVVHREKADD
jgi:hypothetical protein